MYAHTELKSIHSEFNPPIHHPLYFIRQAILEAVIAYAPLLKGQVLDFGCGSKPYQKLFIAAENYIGLDFQGEGHNHNDEPIDIFYDGKNIPFENDTFDAIFSSEVFEHIFNIDEVLKELYRVLKPEGLIFITCPFVWNEHEIPNDYARYTLFALRYLFEKHGFEVKIAEKKGNYITAIGQLLALYLLSSSRLNRYIGISNRLTRLLNKHFPIKQDFYLSNIILAQKK